MPEIKNIGDMLGKEGEKGKRWKGKKGRGKIF